MTGEYLHSIDVKGRLNFPAKLREELGCQFILTKGLDGCIFVYSLSEWKKIEERMAALPLSQSRNVQRFLSSGACEVEPDKQGRILVPANLRSHAGLDKDIIVAGVGSRAEIWDKQRWEDNCAQLSSEMIAEQMEALGF